MDEKRNLSTDPLFQEVLKTETAFYNTLEARMGLSQVISSRGGRCSMMEKFTLDAYAEKQQNDFVAFCKAMADFVQNSPLKANQIEIHDYFQERKTYPTRYTGMLARPYPEGLPEGCKIMFRGNECQYEFWLVLTTDPAYMAKDAQRMGYNWATKRDQQLNRQRLLQSGFIVVAEDPETRKRLQKQVQANGDNLLLL
jgi:hypothetical protein